MAPTTEVSFDERRLRDVFASFPTGVVALSVIADDRPMGLAASSFVPVSLSPALVSVCVSQSSSTWPRIRELGLFGLSVLGEDHDHASRRLSGPEADRFTGIEWFATEGGAVLLSGAAAWFECQVESEVSAGDHLIVLFRIKTAKLHPSVSPLIFQSVSTDAGVHHAPV